MRSFHRLVKRKQAIMGFTLSARDSRGGLKQSRALAPSFPVTHAPLDAARATDSSRVTFSLCDSRKVTTRSPCCLAAPSSALPMPPPATAEAFVAPS